MERTPVGGLGADAPELFEDVEPLLPVENVPDRQEADAVGALPTGNGVGLLPDAGQLVVLEIVQKSVMGLVLIFGPAREVDGLRRRVVGMALGVPRPIERLTVQELAEIGELPIAVGFLTVAVA